MQRHLGLVAAVEGGHQGVLHIGVSETFIIAMDVEILNHIAAPEAQAVSELVGGSLHQVGAIIPALREFLLLVEVDVAAPDREEGVGQRAAEPVEGVRVPVIADLELDVDVDVVLAGAPHRPPVLEGEGRHPGPHRQGPGYLRPHILTRQLERVRVARDGVGQTICRPLGALQSIPLPK